MAEIKSWPDDDNGKKPPPSDSENYDSNSEEEEAEADDQRSSVRGSLLYQLEKKYFGKPQALDSSIAALVSFDNGMEK